MEISDIAVNSDAIDNNNWKLEEAEFVDEMENRGLNIAVLSSPCIKDIMTLSYRIVKEWRIEGFEDQTYGKEFLNCLALDIGCILIEVNYFKFLLQKSKYSFFSYPVMLINLLFDNYHLSNASQKKHFDKNIQFYQEIVTKISFLDKAA